MAITLIAFEDAPVPTRERVPLAAIKAPVISIPIPVGYPMIPLSSITFQDSNGALWNVVVSTGGVLQVKPDVNSSGAQLFVGKLDFSTPFNSSLLGILL